MKYYYEEITFSTSKRFEIRDISEKVYEIFQKSGIKNGLILVFAPHATAAIILNENENGLKNDILNILKELVPPEDKYMHDIYDNNAHAHILSSIIKPFVILPIKDGKIIRGTWQNIMFIELDGPRSLRRVVVIVMGEWKLTK